MRWTILSELLSPHSSNLGYKSMKSKPQVKNIDIKNSYLFLGNCKSFVYFMLRRKSGFELLKN